MIPIIQKVKDFFSKETTAENSVKTLNDTSAQPVKQTKTPVQKKVVAKKTKVKTKAKKH